MGSSPVRVTSKKEDTLRIFLFAYVPSYRTGLEGGSRFAGAKRIAVDIPLSTDKSTAKDAIDNGGAGRAAKGESPVRVTF